MIPYAIFRLIIAVAVGAIFYIADREGGTGLYRWWYGMTHENALSPDVHKGFVHNRTTKSRVIWATILSSVIAVPALMYSQHNALLELALWLASIPIIVGAFMLGPRVSNVWGRRDNMYTAVDKWERGEGELPGRYDLKSNESADAAVVEQKHQEPTEPPADIAAPAPAMDRPTDPQDLVDRFINRGKP